MSGARPIQGLPPNIYRNVSQRFRQSAPPSFESLFQMGGGGVNVPGVSVGADIPNITVAPAWTEAVLRGMVNQRYAQANQGAASNIFGQGGVAGAFAGRGLGSRSGPLQQALANAFAISRAGAAGDISRLLYQSGMDEAGLRLQQEEAGARRGMAAGQLRLGQETQNVQRGLGIGQLRNQALGAAAGAYGAFADRESSLLGALRLLLAPYSRSSSTSFSQSPNNSWNNSFSW